MKAGIRLTQLSHGEPLLGSSWNYKNLHGVQAVEERLKDLFSTAKHLGFTYVIDTIRPQLDASGNLHFRNNGIHSDKWPFERRMELYRLYQSQLGINIVLEVEFPTSMDESNWEKYANFFSKQIVEIYGGVERDKIKYWQVSVTPEIKDSNGDYKCNPVSYVKFLKHVQYLRTLKPGIQIGGPGCFQGIIDYINNEPNNWLAQAIGDVYKPGQPEYTDIGNLGFLPYINFFSFHGKQNTEGFNYDKFNDIVNTLDVTIKQKIGKSLDMFSTFQGWKAPHDNEIALKEQGYYEIREILNGLKNNVIPFKNQLVDEFYDPLAWNGTFDESKMDYGLLYYFLGEKGFKPAFSDYYFILKNLDGFSTVTNDNMVYESNPNLDSVTLINRDRDVTATVIWPNKLSKEVVVIKPHHARKYILPNGMQGSINDSLHITFENFYFIIVYQTIDKVDLDIKLLEDSIGRKLEHTEKTLAHLINLLPDSYNKEVRDVNYYKLLRSLALEIADAKIEVEDLQDNLYLDTVKGDYIYNNFGVLVDLKRRPEWDYEKYRRLVKGVTKSLLEGPTHKSIVEAVKLFTNFDVNIYELYKSHHNIDSAILKGVNPQFAFVVEIEKPIDVYGDQESIRRDTNYIINIVKPAHTISLIIITLAGKEDYRDNYKNKYGIDFEDSDEMTREVESEIEEGIFGWKSQGYDGQLKTASDIISNNTLTNGGLFIGPRYILHDDVYTHLTLTPKDEYKDVLENFYSILNYNVDDEYKDVEDETYSDAIYNLKEHKFGLNHNSLIELTGGPSKIKTLNNYKLAFGSKLKDKSKIDMVFGSIGDFFKEKYTFRNMLNAFSFNKPNGFNTGKFSTSPDIISDYNINPKDLNFKKKVIRLSNGELAEVERLKEHLSVKIDGNNETIDKNVEDNMLSEALLLNNEENVMPYTGEDWFKLNNPHLNKNKLFKGVRHEVYDIHQQIHIEYDKVKENVLSEFDKLFLDQVPIYLEEINASSIIHNKDKYKNVEDYLDVTKSLDDKYDIKYEESKNNVNVYYQEELRDHEVKNLNYHIHKKLIKSIKSFDDVNVHIPIKDVFKKDQIDKESLTKVYINGVLVPHWAYEELTSYFDSSYASGIRFYRQGPYRVYPGDIVTILYVQDKEVIIGNLPIEHDNYSEIEFGELIDNWKSVKLVEDELIVDYGYSDIFNKPIEKDHLTVTNSNEEKYEYKSENVTFQGPDYLDHIKWNRTVSPSNRLTLNISKLNNSIMFGFIQDGNNFEITPFDKYKTPIENYDINDIESEFKDTIKKPKPLSIFNTYFEEVGVKDSFELIDNVPEIGMGPNDYYKPKNDFGDIIDSHVNVIEKYNVNNEKYYNDLILDIFKDKLDINIIDKHGFKMGLFELYHKPLDDFNNYFINFSNKELYNIKDDYESSNVDLPLHYDLINMKNILESNNYEFIIGDHINKVEDSNTNHNINRYYDILNKDIKDEFGEYDLSCKENHILQDNIKSAFLFGNSVLGLSKFVYKPVIDNNCFDIDYSDKVNLNKNDYYEYNVQQLEGNYYLKDETFNGNILNSNIDNYNYEISDKLEPKKIEQYIYDRYKPKKIECNLKLFKVVAGEEQVIRDSIA